MPSPANITREEFSLLLVVALAVGLIIGVVLGTWLCAWVHGGAEVV